MPLLTRQDLRHHSRLAWACLTALGAVALTLAALGKSGAALGTGAALLGCLGLILPPRERMAVLPRRLRALPRWLDCVPVLASLTSTPGYGLGWYYRPGPYDEVVHLLNGLLAGAVFLAWLTGDGKPRSLPRLIWLGTAFGFALAVGWEAFEWTTGLIGDAVDTVTDIALTTLGTTLAVAWMARRQAPRARAPGGAGLACRQPR